MHDEVLRQYEPAADAGRGGRDHIATSGDTPASSPRCIFHDVLRFAEEVWSFLIG